MLITQEQFDRMKYEVLRCRPSKYDALCEIAMSFLSPQINKWCFANPILNGRDETADILHNTIICLMQRIITDFFCNEHRYTEEGSDIRRFAGWIKAIAYSEYVKASIKIGGGEKRSIISFEENCENTVSEDYQRESHENRTENIYLLEKAKNQILGKNVKPYKVIAWLAVYVFILVYDFTKIETNRFIEKELSGFTLYEAFEFILRSSEKIEWLEFSQVQKERIYAELKEPCEENCSYAEVKLEKFYMKKGGVGTLSDWWNKMNKLIDWSQDDDE